MEKHIIDLVETAVRIEKVNYEEYTKLIDIVLGLLDTLSYTSNCPDNWRSIGETLVEKYNGTKLYDELKLYEYDI